MAYKIKLQKMATEDLKCVRKFLEKAKKKFPDVNPTRTLREIRDEIKKLKDWPNRHPHLEDNSSLRQLTVGNYAVLYQVDEKNEIVKIQYIYHQSRDMEKALARETPTLAPAYERDFELEEEDEYER